MSRPVVIQKCKHGNMAEKELICVGVATLHRSKDCKHSNGDVLRQYLKTELSRLYCCCFPANDLSLITAQVKYTAIVQTVTILWPSWIANTADLCSDLYILSLWLWDVMQTRITCSLQLHNCCMWMDCETGKKQRIVCIYKFLTGSR